MSDKHLHDQLIKLGDMMGDGLHLEPDGKWITREYRKIMEALGYRTPRKRNPKNTEKVNELMKERVVEVSCSCGGELKQTRSGSMKAKCVDCEKKFTLLKRKR